MIVTEGTLSAEEEEDNVDEYVVIKNGILDGEELAALVEEAILLSFPMRLLCDEECEGLCPTCGKPKREGKRLGKLGLAGAGYVADQKMSLAEERAEGEGLRLLTAVDQGGNTLTDAVCTGFNAHNILLDTAVAVLSTQL